jgi:hypothetical protein
MGIVVAIAVVLLGGGVVARLVAPHVRFARGMLVGAVVLLAACVMSTPLRAEWRFWAMTVLGAAAAAGLWPDPSGEGARPKIAKAAWAVPPLLALGLELQTGLPVARAVFSAVIVAIAQFAVGMGIATLGRKKAG